MVKVKNSLHLNSYCFPFLIISITILSGLILSATKASADDTDVVDQINITVPESCSVDWTVSPSSGHTKTMQNGQYATDIGTTTFKTYCNDNSGYAIYAVGYSDDTIGNTLMKHDTSSTYDFNTGTATNGNTSNWAMKLTAISGTYAPTIHSDTNGAFTSYHVVPSEYTKVVSFASNTDLPGTGVNATGSGFTSTYAAWISTTQVAGTYTGKVKYKLVHPATEVPLYPHSTEAGCIRYYPNGGNVEGTMGCQSISSSATSATLLASNFSRAGYGFAGWSKTYDYSDSTGFLGPQEDITFTAGQYTGSNNGLSLYARWIKSTGNLQGWTGCSSMTSGAVTALTDQRDSETYAVAKLADGKCWMIENLRLDNTAELTLANTNNPLNDGTNVTLKHNYTDTDTYNTLSASSSVAYNANTAPDGWCTTDSAACDNQSRLSTDNTANRATNPNNNSSSMYSYGNYYNWYSATAGNGTYSKSSGDVAGDLCPNGWKLPYGNISGNGNTAGGFYYLNYKINNDADIRDSNASKKLRAYPNNFVYSGEVYGRSVGHGGDGYYWSSTASSNNGAYNLNFGSSYVYSSTVNYFSKFYGKTVRCVYSGV